MCSNSAQIKRSMLRHPPPGELSPQAQEKLAETFVAQRNINRYRDNLSHEDATSWANAHRVGLIAQSRKLQSGISELAKMAPITAEAPSEIDERLWEENIRHAAEQTE